jgi:Rieske 2Fe-2S family protein
VALTHDAAPTSGTRPEHRLPAAAYYDVDWYRREMREVFGRTWNLVGHELDIAKPGDFLAVDVGGEPIVVVRRTDGELTGYVNICRHRGMVVVTGDPVTGTGSCDSALRCPYHGWEWDLEGQLQRVPQRRTQFPDLQVDALGLHPVAVATWGGLVFVHPDPDAARTFESWLGDFPAHMPDYPWDELVEVHRERMPVRCNWKLYMENHVDWLHLWYLHDESLGMYDHHRGVVQEAARLHFVSIEKMREDRERAASDGLLPIPGQPDDEPGFLRANGLFPNVPVVTSGTSLNTYQVIPTGPETCELDLRVFAMPGSVLTATARVQLRRVLFDEDGRACELMQAAVHSPRFNVGPLAVEHERPIAEFHDHLLAFLEGSPAS